jgi:hypothetical protein
VIRGWRIVTAPTLNNSNDGKQRDSVRDIELNALFALVEFQNMSNKEVSWLLDALHARLMRGAAMKLPLLFPEQSEN